MLTGEMLDHLMAEYAEQRDMMLSVLPHSGLAAGDNADAWLLSERGFRKGAALLYPDRYIVNLRLSDVEIRASFEQKWRYHLGKSEKAGLMFEHAEASEMPRFNTLYHAMLDRKRFPDHSAFGTLDKLMAMEDPRLRPELFFVTREGETVGGAVIFKSGKRAVYLYGATNDTALSLRAGYFMHWHIIRLARDHTEAAWYDLGGTDGFDGASPVREGDGGVRRAGRSSSAGDELCGLADRPPRGRGGLRRPRMEEHPQPPGRAAAARPGEARPGASGSGRGAFVSLRSRLLSQTSVIFASRLGGAVLIFLTQAAMARLWGPQQLGEYLVIIAAVNIAAVILPLGFETIGTYFAASTGRGDRVARCGLHAPCLWPHRPHHNCRSCHGTPHPPRARQGRPAARRALATIRHHGGSDCGGLLQQRAPGRTQRPFAGFFGDTVFRPVLVAAGFAIAFAASDAANGVGLDALDPRPRRYRHSCHPVGLADSRHPRGPARTAPRRRAIRRWWHFALPW